MDLADWTWFHQSNQRFANSIVIQLNAIVRTAASQQLCGAQRSYQPELVPFEPSRLICNVGINRTRGYGQRAEKLARSFRQLTQPRFQHYRQRDAGGRSLIAGECVSSQLFKQKRIAP